MPINWTLARNPLNWLTILAMLLIAGYAAHLALSYFSGGNGPASLGPLVSQQSNS